MAPPQTLPITIPIPGEGAIASFNWNDIASGVAYSIFYAILGEDGPRALASSSIETLGNTKCIAFSQSNIKIASSAFNLPRTIKGTVFFDFYGYQYASGAATITMKLQKYDGSTYTDITSDITYNYDKGSAGTTHLTGISEATETLIKKGEKIVLNISTNSNAAFEGNSSSTPSLFHIPFDIDL